QLIAVSEAGKVYRMTTQDSDAGAYVGTTHGKPVTQRPFWYRDRMIILPGLGETAASPYKLYQSSGVYTLAEVGGTPPKARVGTNWGDWLLLANYYDPSDGDKLKNYRMAWSAVG